MSTPNDVRTTCFQRFPSGSLHILLGWSLTHYVRMDVGEQRGGGPDEAIKQHLDMQHSTFASRDDQNAPYAFFGDDVAHQQQHIASVSPTSALRIIPEDESTPSAVDGNDADKGRKGDKLNVQSGSSATSPSTSLSSMDPRPSTEPTLRSASNYHFPQQGYIHSAGPQAYLYNPMISSGMYGHPANPGVNYPQHHIPSEREMLQSFPHSPLDRSIPPSQQLPQQMVSDPHRGWSSNPFPPARERVGRFHSPDQQPGSQRGPSSLERGVTGYSSTPPLLSPVSVGETRETGDPASENSSSLAAPTSQPESSSSDHALAAAAESEVTPIITPTAGGDTGANSSGRYQPVHYPVAFKMLVSNNVAGSIIGRGGQTIAELQELSSARIKLSQTGDYFPGTQDRVCLVQGEPDPVKAATRLLLERLYMLQEHQYSQQMAWQLQKQNSGIAPTFDFIVRVLVPNTSCGLIIGKSGSNIKFMEESSGVTSVRLSPKENLEGYAASYMAQPTAERVVTIAGGSVDSCTKCVSIILDGMISQGELGRYANMTTSYSRSMHLPAGYVSQGPFTGRPIPGPTGSPRQPGLGGASNLRFSLPSAFPVDQQHGYDRPSLVPGQGIPIPADAYVGIPSSDGAYFSRQGNPAAEGGAVNDTIHPSSSVSEIMISQFEQTHISGQLVSSSPSAMMGDGGDYTGMVHAPTFSGPGSFTAQVLVPDRLVGLILGRGGRTLAELQTMTETRIRISQRGEYMPGTKSRVITVRGPTAQSVWQAQALISQRMASPPSVNSSRDSRPDPETDLQPTTTPEHDNDNAALPPPGQS
jgi:RNA-binding protein Nova